MTRWLGAVPAPTMVADPHLVGAVDRALLGSGAAAERITTHIDRSGPVARTAVVALLDVELDEQETAVAQERLAAELAGAAADETTLAEAADGTSGRCVRFPGQEHVTGDHTVGELTERTGLDAVVGIGRELAPADVVGTAGFVRPQLLDGRLVLLVEPAVGGVLRPVEVESPHQCCGGAH